MQGRIDVHCHAVPPLYRDAVAANAPAGIAVRTPDWSPELGIALMDRCGVQAMITSISVPGTHLGDPAGARDLSRACNEDAAATIARHPARYGAYAALPLPDVEAACAEIVHALDVLKLDGVGLFTSYGDIHLGDSRLDPVMELLNARRAAVFVHPTAHPSAGHVDLQVPAFLMEYPFDTTRAAVNLVLSGTLDRYPDIDFILSHAGGTLPVLSWRVSELTATLLAEPALAARYPVPLVAAHGGSLTPDLVMQRFRRFWYDTANAAGPQVFAALEHVADPDRILFGSDWPYVSEAVVRSAVAAVDASAGTPKQVAAVNRGNALRLFPRLAGV